MGNSAKFFLNFQHERLFVDMVRYASFHFFSSLTASMSVIPSRFRAAHGRNPPQSCACHDWVETPPGYAT